MKNRRGSLQQLISSLLSFSLLLRFEPPTIPINRSSTTAFHCLNRAEKDWDSAYQCSSPNPKRNALFLCSPSTPHGPHKDHATLWYQMLEIRRSIDPQTERAQCGKQKKRNGQNEGGSRSLFSGENSFGRNQFFQLYSLYLYTLTMNNWQEETDKTNPNTQPSCLWNTAKAGKGAGRAQGAQKTGQATIMLSLSNFGV